MAFLSLKLAVISTGVVSLAVILKLSIPVVTELPSMYSTVISWLRPPYLYLVVNGIIISIVASSKLQLQKNEEPPLVSTSVINGESTVDLMAGKVREGGDDEALVSSKVVQPPQRSDSMELLLFGKEEKEKPLVSSRFGNKKSAKPSQEGGRATLLGASKSKRQDTLENTWKMITGGRPMPLTRHLKKSDNWDSQLHREDTTSPPPKMNKSETFSDTKSTNLSRSQGSGKLRKEPSFSQEELNRRVEAFIKKFNEEMKLQRQHSLNQYQEMIARGACQ